MVGNHRHGPPRPRRARYREETEAEIKAIARRQLVESRGTELSLRAIAREMGMTAPGLYRYFDSLDDLVRALCHDYLDEVSAQIGAAVEQAGPDLEARGHAAVRALRRWGIAHPAEFGLLFRSKSPGPVAFPGQQDTWTEEECPHAEQFARVFLTLFEQLWRERPFPLSERGAVPQAAVDQAVHFGRDLGADLPPMAMWVFASSWVRLYSVISLEVLGQLDFMFSDLEPYFEAELASVMESMGVTYQPPVR